MPEVKSKPSPCLTCTRVSPRVCERTGRGCPIWESWFLARWERINAFWLRYGNNSK